MLLRKSVCEQIDIRLTSHHSMHTGQGPDTGSDAHIQLGWQAAIGVNQKVTFSDIMLARLAKLLWPSLLLLM